MKLLCILIIKSSALDAAKAGQTVIFPCVYIGVKNADRFIKKKEQVIE